MSDNVVTIDRKQVDNLFRKLDPEKRNEAMMNALKSGAAVLAQKTRSNLKKGLGSGADTPRPERNKNYAWKNKPMVQGVTLNARDTYNTTVQVSIMGDPRLKWFEKGVNERYRGARKSSSKYRLMKDSGKLKSTGSIKRIKFFEQAKQDDNQITQAIERTLIKEINELTQ